MAQVRWTPQAVDDLEAICLFIARDDKPEKSNFCQLVATQTGIVKQRAVSDCSYAKTITLQALDPGERVSLAVPKWEAKETLILSSDVRCTVRNEGGLERINFRFAHIRKANHSSPLTKGGREG